MINRKTLTMALGLGIGLLLAPATASATPAASGLANSGIAGIATQANQVTKVHRRRLRHRRHRGPSFYFGFGAPSYYYDPYPYYYRPRVRRYRGGSCHRWHRRCVRNWGYRNSSYRQCMRYHGCRPR